MNKTPYNQAQNEDEALSVKFELRQFVQENWQSGQEFIEKLTKDLTKTIDSLDKKLDKDPSQKLRLQHLCILRSKSKRISELVEQNGRDDIPTIELQVLQESVRNSKIGGVIFTLLSLAAAAAAIAGILVITGALALPIVATIACATALSAATVTKAAIITGGIATYISTQGSIGLFARAHYGQKVLDNLTRVEDASFIGGPALDESNSQRDSLLMTP